MNKNAILMIVGGVVLVGVSYVLIFNNMKKNEAVTPPPISSNGDNVQLGSSLDTLPVEPAAVGARKDLALKLGVNEKSIVILNIEEKTWTDGCLGLGGMAESCLAVMIPGFRIEMQAGARQYAYRTNKDGSVVKYDETEPTPNTNSGSSIINGVE